jgi:hypothetical protein
MSKFFPVVFLFFGLILSCGPRGGETEPEDRVEAVPFPAPLAILKAGENPLWFELAEGGPRLIDSPGGAALVPFIPWPLARHVRGMLSGSFGNAAGEEGLVMAVNRDGFLRFVPWSGAGPVSGDDRGVALYRTADAPRWGRYSLAALFPFEGRAAILLYRDDFFSDSGASPPSPRAFALEPVSPELRPLDLPVFGDFSPEEGWDVDALRLAPDGYWYYRVLRKDTGRPEIGYYRTRSLDLKGEVVSVSAFQNSVLPEPLAAAPSPLRSVLEAAFDPATGNGSALVVFSAFPGPRRFSLGRGTGGGTGAAGPVLNGFYREPGEGSPGAALVILPGGRGSYTAVPAAGAGRTGEPAGPPPLSFSLPPLPERYAYTGAALLGDTLFAAWEEQEGHSIGAAGFMVVRFAGFMIPGSN